MNTMNTMNPMNFLILPSSQKAENILSMLTQKRKEEEYQQKSMLTLQPSTTGLKKTQEKSIGYFTILKCTK